MDETMTKLNEHGEKMHKAFELVSPERWGASDWKGAVNAFVTEEELKKEGLTIEDVKDSVAYMTATEAKVRPYNLASETPGKKGFHVTAKGYRMGPAGDH